MFKRLNLFRHRASALEMALKPRPRSAPSVSCDAVELLESRRLMSASISGTVFNDLNASGARDPGEPALVGVRVYVDVHQLGHYAAGDPSAVTDQSGNYTINGLAPGSYVARQALPAQFRQTFPGNGIGQHISVPSYASNNTINLTGCDFGDTQKVRVSGFVFSDNNGNGRRDNGETLLPGVTVYLDKNGDGKLDNGEPSTVTNTYGYFVIGDLPAGSYTVRVQPQGYFSKYVQTAPARSGGYTVDLRPGQTADNLLFGIKPTGPAPTGAPIVLLSESRTVLAKGQLDDGQHISYYAKSQSASGFSPFNGNANFSADTGVYQDGPEQNDIGIDAQATMQSILSTTQFSASGEVDASEGETFNSHSSDARAEMTFAVTFKVTRLVSYQLSASINPTTVNGLGSVDQGSFVFAAASGPNPVNQMYAGYQSPLKVTQSGLLAPGTYTISETAQAEDNGDIYPSVPYSLSIKFT